jgi:cytochrome c peroxidase
MKKYTSILFKSLMSASAWAGHFPQVPIPSQNSQSPAKVSLGRQLFFDGRLSKDGTISCASCHNVVAPGGADTGKSFSAGVGGKLGGRNSPTVLNAAFMSVQFWDGRAPTLEDQAKGPMLNPVEMAMPSHDEVVARLKKVPGYVSQFQKVFGTREFNIDHVVQAIASYERTLVSSSRFDRFKDGNVQAISESAKRGYELVQSVGCTSCHSGPMFAGPALPVGTGFYQKFPVHPGSKYDTMYDLLKDTGRMEVTKNAADKNMFRVPTWRNIEHTAPYFHNGSVARLDEAVRVMAKTQLNKDLKETEVNDIVAFLKTLSGDPLHEKKPKLP